MTMMEDVLVGGNAVVNLREVYGQNSIAVDQY
jgi:hypothetical protein